MNQSNKTLIALIVMSAILSACTMSERASVTQSERGEAAQHERQQLRFQLASGVYSCELGRKIEIQREPKNENQIRINWQGKPYTLLRFDSASGLPRYEDRRNGLLWIDLPWKSVLMDVTSGQPLANECKAANI